MVQAANFYMCEEDIPKGMTRSLFLEGGYLVKVPSRHSGPREVRSI